MKYRPDIDGLRAISVLAVVFFHAFPAWIQGGFVGVDIFFVISGFLISSLIIEGLENNTFSFAAFYSSRINRIFPTLLLVLALCFLLGWFVLLPNEYEQLGQQIVGGASFISNFFFWHDAGYFDTGAETKPLLHLWSLGIEEQFYILWPLLLWVAWKKQMHLFALMVFVAIFSFILNVKGIKTDTTATFFSPQTRFWELISGSILAWILKDQSKNGQERLLKIKAWLGKGLHGKLLQTINTLISCLGLSIIFFCLLKFNKEMQYPGVWALFPVCGALLIIISEQSWINKTILSNRLIVSLGLVSYPLYLWHWPLLSFAHILAGMMPDRGIRIAAVCLSLILAGLCYRWIEKPIRHAASRQKNACMLVGCMSIAGCFGLGIYQFNGLYFRMNGNETELMSIQTIMANPLPPVKKYFECRDLIPFLGRFSFSSCHLTQNKPPEILFLGDLMPFIIKMLSGNSLSQNRY